MASGARTRRRSAGPRATCGLGSDCSRFKRSDSYRITCEECDVLETLTLSTVIRIHEIETRESADESLRDSLTHKLAQIADEI